MTDACRKTLRTGHLPVYFNNTSHAVYSFGRTLRELVMIYLCMLQIDIHQSILSHLPALYAALNNYNGVYF